MLDFYLQYITSKLFSFFSITLCLTFLLFQKFNKYIHAEILKTFTTCLDFIFFYLFFFSDRYFDEESFCSDAFNPRNISSLIPKAHKQVFEVFGEYLPSVMSCLHYVTNLKSCNM